MRAKAPEGPRLFTSVNDLKTQRSNSLSAHSRLTDRCGSLRGRKDVGVLPGGELVLLLAGPRSSHGGEVVDRAHAVDGGV